MKGTLLDIQSRSMRDNLIFSGIPENYSDNSESTIKHFICNELKLPVDTVNKITFHCVHCLGKSLKDRPRLIIAKFEHYKQKKLVKSKGRELKGTVFGINDHFPREIMERRKILYPDLKLHRQAGSRASLVVDKLYINEQLYRDSKITSWLI